MNKESISGRTVPGYAFTCSSGTPDPNTLYYINCIKDTVTEADNCDSC